jgi:hypothetical protein
MLKKRGYISKIRTLQTPAKIQDFLNTIPFNFELDGVDTLKSPLRTLRENNAHCFEGALLAAYLLSLQGYTPLLMYLQSTKKDFDHVIAPFKVNGYWGAISKTNHAVLRYREPVYKTIRELALSYFHEYFLDDGTKTLRYYTEPLDVTVFDDSWIDSEEDLWGIDAELDKMKHFEIVPKKYLKKLRKADQVEREAGKIVEWKKKK